MEHKWDDYFDASSKYWEKLQKISEAFKGKHWKLVDGKRVWY